MHVTLVQVQVKPENIADFIAATQANHRASVHEAGNLRFDVLQDADNPAYFVLYEAYRDPASAAAHKEAAHYRHWREQVAPWMAEARSSRAYRGLFPEIAS